MGDVADILGRAPRATASEGEALLMETGSGKAPGSVVSGGGSKKKKKPAGMSREVFNLIGKDGLAPAVVSKKAGGFKDKRDGAQRTRWVWTDFKNSARGDDCRAFKHWVKASTDYPDYPFARFNVAKQAVAYSDEEYAAHLADPDWSREETDALIALCDRFDLRWPVIHDRYPQPTDPAASSPAASPSKMEVDGSSKGKGKEWWKARSIEDLQARYYSLRRALRDARRRKEAEEAQAKGLPVPQPMNISGFDEDGDDFDHPYERRRRRQLALLFTRSKEEELDEYRLREELRAIDAALKRARKHPVKSQVRAPEEAREATMVDAQGRQLPLVADKLLQEARPEPRPGHPYLQSARLTVPMSAPRLQKGMLLKVKQLLADLSLPARPLPTKTVCDLYDDLRRDAVELFTLMKVVRVKEAQLKALREGADPSQVFARPLTGSGSDLLLGGLAPAGGVLGGAAGTKKSHKRSAGAAFPRSGGAGLAQAGSDSSLSATAAEGGNANKRKR